MSVRTKLTTDGIADRWPHISRVLRLDAAGRVDHNFLLWNGYILDTLSPGEEAASYEEWADFYEYRMAQRADELADDRVKRNLVEKWTDSMAYCCRRSAILARGADPGEWIPEHVRRPDLAATSRAIVDEIVAALDADDDHDPVREIAGARVA